MPIHVRWLRISKWLKCPVLLCRIPIHRTKFCGAGFGSRVNSSIANPCFKVSDYRVWQFAFGRHFKSVELHCGNEKTVLGLPGNYSRSTVAAFQRFLPTVQSKPAAQNFCIARMTLKAMFNKDRSDSRFKKINANGCRVVFRQGNGTRHQRENYQAGN